MILMIDTMAERYKLLPSEIVNRGSTFDLYVMDAAMSYHNYQHNKAQNKVDPNSYTHDEMLEMIRKARD